MDLLVLIYQTWRNRVCPPRSRADFGFRVLLDTFLCLNPDLGPGAKCSRTTDRLD